MPEECMDALAIKPGGVYVDCTVGGGGHSELIAKRLGEGGRLICIDRDEDALTAAGERLAPYADRITFVHSNYSEILNILDGEKIDGALIDLGVSSYQLDTPERGFSYNYDAPLDMRMDRSDSRITAWDVVNTYSPEQLTKILYDYGEENFAPRIVRAIVEKRGTKPIETTLELADTVKAVVPRPKDGGNSAKKTFQAIRIEVNDELGRIEPTLRDLTASLKPGGRLAVITFHSLEDRIVKQVFASLAKGCTCPPDFPVCVCGKKPEITLPFRKPLTAGRQELDENTRSHSAKLRVAEKI